MCGIVGILALNETGKKQITKLSNAVDALEKRGPDSRGIFTTNNLGLGHRRLSIIDTSEKGNQPFTDETERYTIVFNGEFYNYKEHKHNLESKGHTFKSNSDTEVLLKLYIEEGAACLEKINGFFAFAIFDKKEQTLFIARDRIGIKPLHFYQDNSKFIFASELKAIFQFEIEKKIDRASLFLYLQLNYLPPTHSILENCRKLPPGHYLKIDLKNQSFEEKKYYSIPIKKDSIYNISNTAYKEAQNKIKTLLNDSIEKRLVADVPLGTFLSGGIDSSVISAITAQKIKKLNTFSIGYADEPFFDETKYAQLVAKMHNTEHTVFSLTNKDLYENLNNVLDYIDEPFADSSAIAVYILSKKTKEHLTVALSGDGADELFSGYNKHMAEFKARNVNPGLSLLRFASPLFKILPQSRNSKLGDLNRKLFKFSEGLKLSNKERYWRWATLITEEEANYLIKEKLNFSNQRLSDDAHSYKKRKENILKFINKKGDFNEILYTDLHLVLQGDMLTKVDSMSMANSLEVRTPFLDHNLVDYVSQLPSAFKINASMKKKILQETFKEILPPELFNRPKHGFEVPLLKWFKTELKDQILNNYLNNDFIEEQNIFNPDAVKSLKNKLFSNNPGDVHATIWALIVFQHWYKKYFCS